MTEQTHKQWKFFLPWNEHKQEAWLREMAQAGWHFKKVYWPGSYRFERDTPRDVRYWLDYKTSKKDRDTYLAEFEQAGWTHLQSHNGWQYFRRTVEAGEKVVDDLSEREARIEKYKRMRSSTETMVMLFLLLLFVPFYAADVLNVYSAPFFAVLFFVQAITMIKLRVRINQLKRNTGHG